MKRLSLIGMALLSGCIFSTRTPQPPDTSSAFIWTQASTPEYLMQDLTGSLENLDATDYMRVFISSTDSTGSGTNTFSFTPSADLSQAQRAIFTGWNPQSEDAWVTELSTLVPQNTQITVILSTPVYDEASSTSASVTASYAISMPASVSSSVVPGLVQGSFQMELAYVTTQEGTKEWRIVSWSDFLPSNGTGPTWSDLKVQLSP